MNRLGIFAVLLCIVATISAQKYISFDNKIMSPEKDFSLNEWLMEKTDAKTNEYKVSSSVTRTSKISGIEHSSYRLSYRNIPLAFNSINVHKKDEEIVSINGNLSLIHNINLFPSLTPQESLQAALKHVQAKSYSWQVKPHFLAENDDTQYLLQEPIPELVICPDFRNTAKTPTLAYKIELFSIIPFMHQDVYVNANNGEILYSHPLMKNINGIAETRYSGTQTISTSYVNNSYRLVDTSRGNGIFTYSLYDYNYIPDFLTDNDNIWTSTEYHDSKQDAALDAHWGAMKVYDFFLEKYGRNGIDNNGMEIYNYVNCPWKEDDYAGWDRSTHSMYYGKGNSIVDAVTSLDVIAHELGHGITDSYERDMVYAGETGALNESLSDIWAACVEYYAAPNKQRWWIEEDIRLNDTALRYMDNPKLKGDPDTYWGMNYLDPATNYYNFVVHHNSGVPNHWFYLLSDGGIGTNDMGYTYSVEGIGIENAADIVYESLNYIQSEMTFAEFAEKTRNVAIYLYGACADETADLIEAWKAVGVPIADIPNTINVVETLRMGDRKIYFANNLLTASNLVKNGAIEVLESANKIVLAPGFRAEIGAIVKAQIVSCNPTDNRNNSYVQSRISSPHRSPYPVENNHCSPISIFTNPATNEIIINGICSDCKYAIYDPMGKLLTRGVLSTPYTINTAQFLLGTYILRISTEGGYSCVKFIKQ